MIGKAWCLADATDGPVRPGDLLTSGRRPGHAQVAGNPIDAFGAVIGKALTGSSPAPVRCSSSSGWVNRR